MTTYQNDIHTCHADCQNPACIAARKSVKAFPLLSNWDNNKLNGMDLRDYFAAKAIQGLLANPKLSNQILKEGGAFGGWIEKSAYGWADAMMKAREQ